MQVGAPLCTCLLGSALARHQGCSIISTSHVWQMGLRLQADELRTIAVWFGIGFEEKGLRPGWGMEAAVVTSACLNDALGCMLSSAGACRAGMDMEAVSWPSYRLWAIWMTTCPAGLCLTVLSGTWHSLPRSSSGCSGRLCLISGL